MFRIFELCGTSILAAALALSVPLAGAYAARNEIVLYAFEDGNDGAEPLASLISDKAGNLYGTTQVGGGANGYGTVFKLAPDGSETVLHSFAGGTSDGSLPEAGVIADYAGNLYGTTYGGGANGFGTVFKLAPDGTETVLYAFKGGDDGDGPFAGLIRDSAHNLYGTTLHGGASGNCTDGCGTVFKLAPDGTETVLHTFAGGSDGANPYAGVIADGGGNLYGTTQVGGTGCDGNGCGTVFKVAMNGSEAVLYNFCSRLNCADGTTPYSGLIADSAGNFYGTTALGGITRGGRIGNGTIFKLAPDGTETVLYVFPGGSHGEFPSYGSLLADKAGNLYGTAGGGANGQGIVFRLATNGNESAPYAFKGRSDGSSPSAGVIADKAGNLYGTTQGGGNNNCTGGCGIVFEIEK
jgi:uncharacterized repeat protein (TIGR03803 family)